MGPVAVRTVLLTALALLAFASNSLLNRQALGEASIDAASYTAVRLASGALVLCALALGRRTETQSALGGSWRSALCLFLYAACFSLAYLGLTTGTGALILFGSVQCTMQLVALHGGERPHAAEWLGLALALGGLAYLVSPGLAAPAPWSSASMAVAGIAWGIYSLRGRGSQRPLAETAGNFARAVPLCLVFVVLPVAELHLSTRGVVLAVLSGGLASGLGYVVWYAALRGLTTTRAGLVQLLVPVLAAWGGVLLLGEALTSRLLLAGGLILGGIGLSIVRR